MSTDVIFSYLPIYMKAFILTIEIAWIGIVIAFGIGIISAFILYFKIPILSIVVKIYIELFRNTPLLVQLFFIYFGLPRIGITISAEVCGIAGLGLLGGGYMAESIRSGLDTVSSSQIMSASALGMTKPQIFVYVIFPQAVSVSIPAILANIIFLLKETSVFSAISLMDLMFTAKDLIGLYYNTLECLFLLVIFYCLMLLPVSIIGGYVEKKVRLGMFGV